MNTEKIKAVSKTLNVTNSPDADRTADISAFVRYSNENTVEGIDSGTVIKDGVMIATFNRWGEDSLNVNFQGQADKATTLAIIEDFIINL